MSEKKSNWIDVHDDDLMVKLGLRYSKAIPRDSSIWTKTAKEKKEIKKARNKQRLSTSIPPMKVIPVYDKIIIYLTKNDKFPNTVYSKKCWQYEIPKVLDMFSIVNSKGERKSIVSKYFYNGKTYKPREYPYWPYI